MREKDTVSSRNWRSWRRHAARPASIARSRARRLSSHRNIPAAMTIIAAPSHISLFCPEEVGGLLGHGDNRGVDIPRRHRGHYGGIDHAQVLHAFDVEFLVDDRPH